MAYDKIIPLRSRLDHCLDYVLNEDKTSLSYALSYAENPEKSHQLVTGINCEARTAYEEMRATKRRWDKRNGILGYHLVHSYAPGEVTPEQAHAAGVEFARRLLGDHYEAVVATHIDREHYHCHIVFNSVSFVDGRKYRSDFKSYFGEVRGTSNAVSQDFGLSVIQPKDKGKHYAQWDAEHRGKATISSLVRQDIDAAIRESFTFDTFLTALRRQGYSIKFGPNVKHAAVRPPGAGRFFRLDSLGDGYTEADIRTRLAAMRRGEAPPPPAPELRPRKQHRYTIQSGRLPERRNQKLKGFRALYVYYLYFLGVRRPRGAHQYPFPIRAEVIKLHRYQRQMNLLQTYHIDTDDQLTLLGEALQARIDALTGQRKELYGQKRDGKDVTGEIETINRELRRLRGQLKTCGQIEADTPRIRAQAETCRAQARQEKEEQEKRRAAISQSRPDRHFDPVR